LEIFPTLGIVHDSADRWIAKTGHFLAASGGMTIALTLGMTPKLLLPFLVVLAFSPVHANTSVSVEVNRGDDKAYTVEAAFDVMASPETVWDVLTDYEGISGFVSSIRQSTVRRREPGRVVLEQQGVGKAWIVSVPMHVVLEVREEDGRVLAFRDLCGKSFSTYEGRWEISAAGAQTRVSYHLKADPGGRQPAMLARAAIRGSVKKLLDEVRDEILARGAR
jgi:carbon monoxide dehydrogenase subunit G